MDREGMVEIPAARFRMGSNDPYAEEGPVRDVQVDAFAIDPRPVTVTQFTTFVQQTGYVTFSARPLGPADYPDADPSPLVEGRGCFSPHPPVRSGSTTPAAGWPTSPGANWRH
jgi:sulfatase modifying factor 1